MTRGWSCITGVATPLSPSGAASGRRMPGAPKTSSRAGRLRAAWRLRGRASSSTEASLQIREDWQPRRYPREFGNSRGSRLRGDDDAVGQRWLLDARTGDRDEGLSDCAFAPCEGLGRGLRLGNARRLLRERSGLSGGRGYFDGGSWGQLHRAWSEFGDIRQLPGSGHIGNRVHIVALRSIGRSTTLVGCSVVGTELEGLVVVCQRTIQLALGAEGAAPVQVGAGVARFRINSEQAAIRAELSA